MLQDAENKKSEKKEVVGPPLQTASVSVRALIEEKIIQKRTTGKLVDNPRREGEIENYFANYIYIFRTMMI